MPALHERWPGERSSFIGMCCAPRDGCGSHLLPFPSGRTFRFFTYGADGHGEAVKRITAICAAVSYVVASARNKRTARSWSQGAGIVSEDMVWRVALLSVVFLTDIIVFIGLCREEIRDWRGRRSVRLSPRAANENFPALAARRAAR